MQRHLIDSEHLTYCYLLLFGLNYYKMITVIRLETDFINASYTIHKMGPLRLQNMQVHTGRVSNYGDVPLVTQSTGSGVVQ